MTVLGTVRMAERGMFIERDDGASPNVYLHPTIAKRGGLMAPFDGKRVRCEVSRDAFGNYAAVEIAELQLDDMEIPACDRGNVRLSAGEIRDLIELGWLDRSRSEAGASVDRQGSMA